MPRKKKSEDVTEELEEAVNEISEEVSKAINPEKEIEETAEEVEELVGEDLEKVAELESSEDKAKDLEKKKKAILEKVKKLSEKVDSATSEELKEKVKEKKKTDMLVPLEEYVKSGIYLGTRVVTPDMKPFVYRRRADGLAIFNTDLIDEKLKEAIVYLSQFNPEDVILVCKRQAGWNAAEMFSSITGIRVFTKKYPAGVLTNTTLPNFFETEMAIICDSWLDKNALHDVKRVNKKILMLCDTNNFARNTDKIMIGNNKSPRSLGLIFYLLARGYCKARNIQANIPDLEVWTGEKEGLSETEVRESIKISAGAEFGA